MMLSKKIRNDSSEMLHDVADSQRVFLIERY